MAVEIGRRYMATIESHRLRSIADKLVVEIVASTEDGAVTPLVWLTEKAAGVARAQLRVCGFDVDKLDTWELQENPSLLAGNLIPVEIEEYNNKIQARIPTSDAPGKKAVASMTAALRKAKRDGEPPVSAQKSAASADDVPF